MINTHLNVDDHESPALSHHAITNFQLPPGTARLAGGSFGVLLQHGRVQIARDTVLLARKMYKVQLASNHAPRTCDNEWARNGFGGPNSAPGTTKVSLRKRQQQGQRRSRKTPHTCDQNTHTHTHGYTQRAGVHHRGGATHCSGPIGVACSAKTREPHAPKSLCKIAGTLEPVLWQDEVDGRRISSW